VKIQRQWRKTGTIVNGEVFFKNRQEMAHK